VYKFGLCKVETQCREEESGSVDERLWSPASIVVGFKMGLYPTKRGVFV